MAFDFTGKTLSQATVQEIQLELVRRTSFNGFDGERVVASLLAHRNLWEAVMIGRIPVNGPPGLPRSGLIPLRDMPHNFWNMDTLYVLVPDANRARQLARVIKSEHWGGDLGVFANQEEVDDALGSGRETRAVIRVWWD